jgi:hypothetical protein
VARAQNEPAPKAEPDKPKTKRGTRPKPATKPAQPDPAQDPTQDPAKDPSQDPASQPSDPNNPAAPQADPNADPNAPAMPGASPEGAPDAEDNRPEVGPYVIQGKSRDATIGIRITLHSDNAAMRRIIRDPLTGKTATQADVQPFKLETLAMIFPFIPRTATSDMLGEPQPFEQPGGAKREPGFRGRLRIADQPVDDEAEVLSGYPAGTKLAKWTCSDVGEAREIDLLVEFPLRSYEVAFDEPGAMQVAWPSQWPKEFASALQPQLYVEQGINDAGKIQTYDPKPVEGYVADTLRQAGVSDAKSVPPVRLAKLLTSRVWRDVQPTGDGLVRRRRTGELAGVEVKAPASTIADRKGSELDMVALLTAMMRQAGLPARTVIALDLGTKDDKFLGKSSEGRHIRAWVEFALFDEARNTANWVPVDVYSMRRTSPRPAKIDQPWRGFGSGVDFARLAPFALHFHPPTDVSAYGTAGFWGWFVTPHTPRLAEQTISFTTGGVARRPGDELKPITPEKQPEVKPTEEGGSRAK